MFFNRHWTVRQWPNWSSVTIPIFQVSSYQLQKMDRKTFCLIIPPPLCHGHRIYSFSKSAQQSTFLNSLSALLACVPCLLVGCITSQQHASVSQGRMYTDNFTYWPTEIEVAGQTFYITQSQYSDTRPTSPNTDPIMPGAWQGSQWSANFYSTGMTWPGKIPLQAGFESRILRSQGGRLNHSLGQRGGLHVYQCPTSTWT